MTLAVFCLWSAVRNKWERIEEELAPEFEFIGHEDIGMPTETAFRSLLFDVYMRKLPALYPDKRDMYWTVITEKARLLSAYSQGTTFRVIRARYIGEGESGAATDRKKSVLRKIAPAPNPTKFKMNLNLHASDSPVEAAYLDDVFAPLSLRHVALRRADRPRAEFVDRLNNLRCWAAAQSIDVRKICVVSGGVLEACGLRQAGDLDFIAPSDLRESIGPLPDGMDLASPGYHPVLTDDDIIARHHFTMLGVKFASLPVVAASKLSGKRVKDNRDRALLEANRSVIDALR